MYASNRRLIQILVGVLLAVASGGWIPAQEKDPAKEKPASGKVASEKSATEKHATDKHESEKAAAGSSTEKSGNEKSGKSGDSKSDAEKSHAAAGHATVEPAGSEHGGHHDATDLSHQDSTPGLTEALDRRSDSAVATLLVFLCLLALLSKFAWRPVMDGLEAREQSIAAKIDDAKRSADKAAEQLRQYEARLAASTEEARGILDQARREAETAKARIVAEAQEVAQRERQRAIDDIATAKNAALQEMTQKSVDLAVSLAGRLIRKQLRAEDHAQLIRDTVDQFSSSQLIPR